MCMVCTVSQNIVYRLCKNKNNYNCSSSTTTGLPLRPLEKNCTVRRYNSLATFTFVTRGPQSSLFGVSTKFWQTYLQAGNYLHVCHVHLDDRRIVMRCVLEQYMARQTLESNKSPSSIELSSKFSPFALIPLGTRVQKIKIFQLALNLILIT